MSAAVRDGTHTSHQTARIAIAGLTPTKCRVNVPYPLQKHVIVLLVCDCYSRDVVTVRDSPITTDAGEDMTPITSVVALGYNAERLVEFDEEQLREAHLVERHEASYRPSPTSFKADGGAHGTETVLRTEVKQAPSRIEERSRDSFLRFRDEWIKNRAREIRQAESASFNTCSEDTASITALNEFYRWRVFDGYKEEQRNEKELKIGMMRGSRDLESFPEDVATAERFHTCRIVCREMGRRVFRRTCHRRATSHA